MILVRLKRNGEGEEIRKMICVKKKPFARCIGILIDAELIRAFHFSFYYGIERLSARKMLI